MLLETYIFHFSGTVIPVAEALERAAARGVVVSVVVDGFGTGEIPAEWQQRWQAAGVRWHTFNPARGWRLLLPKRWRRMHRKLCVVDCRVAFCGGINLLDDYFDPNYGELDRPRFDFAVRVTGPLVRDVHEAMLRLSLRLQMVRDVRQHEFDEALRDARAAARTTPLQSGDAEALADRATGAVAALVLRDNLRFRRRIEGAYRLAIAQAKSEILIANAYFIPGVRLQRALLRAARRGVRITLLLQGRYEYFMQYHASRAVYDVLLHAGIEIIEYEPSFLHAKVAVMDGVLGAMATVGSSNLDPLSLLLAREANVFVRDDAFAAELRSHLVRAIAEGRRVEPDCPHGPPVDEARADLARLRADAHGAAGHRAALLNGGPMSESQDLVVQRPEGLYCPPGDFYIDPWRPVDRAVITHAHADHARPGHGHYLATRRVGRRAARAARRRSRCRRWPTARRSTTTACASACTRPATCSARRRCASSTRGHVWVASGDYNLAGDADEPATRPARRSSRCAATASSPNRPSACRSTAGGRSARCSPRSTPGGAPTPRPAAPACCSATASARRSASSPASTRASARSSCTARSSR